MRLDASCANSPSHSYDPKGERTGAATVEQMAARGVPMMRTKACSSAARPPRTDAIGELSGCCLGAIEQAVSTD